MEICCPVKRDFPMLCECGRVVKTKFYLRCFVACLFLYDIVIGLCTWLHISISALVPLPPFPCPSGLQRAAGWGPGWGKQAGNK